MDKVFTWDVLLKFQKFSKINKYRGTTIRRIKDGELTLDFHPLLVSFYLHLCWRRDAVLCNLCLIGESEMEKLFFVLCLAYNFNWLINLFLVLRMPLCVSSTTNSYEVKYSPTKYIDTTERGLVVVSVNEGDAGRYDCYLGGSLLCSYSITVDAHRWVSHLSPPCELKWRRQLLFVHCPPTLIRCESRFQYWK